MDESERKSQGGSEVGIRPAGCGEVFVGNLPGDTDEHTLREIFKCAGEISSVRCERELPPHIFGNWYPNLNPN